MPPVSRSEFASRLGQLDGEELAAFVGELWAARGFRTRVDGRLVRATNPDGREEVVWVAADAGWLPRRGGQPPEEVDVVVTNRRRAGSRVSEAASVVTADELREMTLYAIDRSAGEALCRRFLDCSITRPPNVSHPLTRAVTAEMSGERAFVLAGGLAVLVIVAGILAAPVAWEQSAPEVTPAPAAAGTPIAFETPTASPTPTPEAEGDRTPVLVDPGLLPPGVSRRGIVDIDALARAHAFGVTDRSYELTLTYREFNGSMRAERERVRVESPTEYVSDIITAGPLSTVPYVIADREAYADGERRFERLVTDTGETYRVQPVEYEGQSDGRFAERVEQYLRWFLSVENSYIRTIESRNGTTFYQVITSGDPWPGVENATGVALIDSDGVVHFLRRVYTVPGTNGTSITITIRYSDFDNTTVEAPRWYGAAVNATKGTAAWNMSQSPTSPTFTRD